MEAAPRLPMLSCELKVSPNNTEFGPSLRKYIRDHYHEDPESYKKEIKEFEVLRQLACKVPRDFTGCSILKRYYSQLHLLQNRFPMTADGVACVPFMWSDMYSGTVFSITDIEYEQACILYNIGSLHSQLGALDTRSNAEGMKIACTHFQCAAWAFQHLQDAYPQPRGSDMAHDLLSFWINIMLAQAQECILEKSMLDNRKSSITAKVAAQVVDYYRCALGIVVSGSPSVDAGSILDIVGSKLFKVWKKYIEFKMSYYTSISHFFMGNQSEEQQKMGERVAWYQSASEYLNAAIKISKTMDRDELNEALTFLMDVIGGKHNLSKKENDFVYHEKVPPTSSLPELKGASLVKGIPFDPTDPDVCGSDVFARLVPMETHASSSLYSEEKAKMLRAVIAKIEEKNEELMTYLSSLQLDESVFHKESEKIPHELFEKCASMSVLPTAVSDLTELTKSLTDTSEEVDAVLRSSRNLLLEEEHKEIKHQEIFGKRVPSMIIVELNKECSKYEEAHKRAVESNKTLKNAVNAHVDNLHLLTGPLDTLVNTLPSVASVKSPDNVKATQEFQVLLNKIDEMRQQRKGLEEQLRDAFLTDDITKRLLALDKKDDVKKTFAEELKKHDQCLSYLDQNLAAQDNILYALTQANASFADVRKAFTEISQERKVMVCSLINSYDAYEDLMLKAKKGLEFYNKLQSNVSRLLNRIRSVSHVQDEERIQINEAQMRKGSRVKVHSPSQDTSTVPKLKDYLPFLMNQKALMIETNSQSLSKSTMSLDHYEMPSAINPMPDFSREHSLVMPPTTLQGDCESNSYPPSTNIGHTKEKFNFTHMGVRPTPLGSEETSPLASCVTPISTICEPFKNFSGSPHWHYSAANHLNTNYTTMYPSPQLSVTPFTTSVSCAQHEVLTPPASNSTAPVLSNLHHSHVSTTSDLVHSVGPCTTIQQYNGSFPLPSYNIGYPSANTYVSGSSLPLAFSTSSHISTPPICNISSSQINSYLTSSSNTLSQSEIHSSITDVPNNNTLANIDHFYPHGSLATSYPMYTEYCNTPYNVDFQKFSLTAPQSSPVISSGISSMHTISSADSSPSTQINQHIPISSSAVVYSNLNYSSPNFPPPQPPISFNNLWDSADQSLAFQHQPYLSAPEENHAVPLQPQVQKSEGTFPIKSDYKTSRAMVDKSEDSKLEVKDDKGLNSVLSVQFSSVIDCALLSDCATKTTQKSSELVLQPEVLKIEEAADAQRNALSQVVKDPLDDSSVRTKFVTEVEKYEKVVEGLVRKSLNGTTPLDQKWKELTDTQEKESRKTSISVARCYPLKNRFPDIMPYDNNRVKLTSAKDDYINASYLKDILPGSPIFLITQAPLPTTYTDFWIMVWEQQVETLICLLPDNEIKNHVYWPKERGQLISFGSFEVSLQSQKEKSCFIERIIGLTHNKNKISRVVVHLQFTMWHSSGVPSSPSQLLQFIVEVLSYQKQQRSLLRPVIVQCSAGVGRSGVFCLTTALLTEMSSGYGPRDVAQVVARISQQRRFLIQDKDQLKFCYDAVLYYAQDLLMRRGILTNRASFDDKLPVSSSLFSHSRHPSEDFILGSGGLAKLQSGLAQMGLSEQSNIPSMHVNDVLSCLDKAESFESSSNHKPVPCDAAKSEKITSTASLSDSSANYLNKQCMTDNDIGNTENNLVSVTHDSSKHYAVSCNLPTKPPKAVSGSSPDVSSSPSSISSILDPSNFNLDCSVSPSKRRITKDSFSNSSSSLNKSSFDSADPLSKLDPLWSMKTKNV